MASDAQITANRANALLSTGPRTEQGKRASAANSTKHGLYSCVQSMTQPELDDFEPFFQHHFRTWLSPADDEAHRLIREIALADYRRERTRSVIYRTMADAYIEFAEEIERYLGEDADIATRDAYILRNDPLTRQSIYRLQRLESSLTRQMDKSRRELKERLALLAQNQPKNQPSPQPLTSDPQPPTHFDKTNPIPGRNAPCPCNSGRKFKQCCGNPANPALNRGAQAA